MNARDIISKLRADGWAEIGQKGSHRQFRHPAKPGKVTVPGKPSRDLPPGLEGSILRQAGLRP
ncbi:MAG: type II toxin-antitoxin system HicA family toxin [Acetobacteraceae bacterium]